MSKIPNWSPVEVDDGSFWTHDKLPAQVRVHKSMGSYEWQVTAHADFKDVSQRMSDPADTKKEAEEMAKEWMRNHPYNEEVDFVMKEFSEVFAGNKKQAMNILRKKPVTAKRFYGYKGSEDHYAVSFEISGTVDTELSGIYVVKAPEGSQDPTSGATKELDSLKYYVITYYYRNQSTQQETSSFDTVDETIDKIAGQLSRFGV